MPFPKRNSKYHSTRKTINGYTFDSTKEAERYVQLSLLERNGVISNLRMQVPFLLIPDQYEKVSYFTPKKGIEKKRQKLVERKVEYIADFVYTDKDGNQVVEDVKGYRDGAAYRIFAIKRKLMLHVHGIKVVEV